MEVTIVIEPTPTGFAAYVPALPGCVAAASGREELLRALRAAIALHTDSGEVPLPVEILTITV